MSENTPEHREPDAHVGDRRLAEELFKRALDAHDANNLEEAYNLYLQVIAADPSLEVAHNNLGMVLIDMGNYQEAISYLTKALEIKPGYAEPYNNLGFVYRRLGDDVTAARYYRKFLELAPDIEDAERIRAWVDSILGADGSGSAEKAPSRPVEEGNVIVGLPQQDGDGQSDETGAPEPPGTSQTAGPAATDAPAGDDGMASWLEEGDAQDAAGGGGAVSSSPPGQERVEAASQAAGEVGDLMARADQAYDQEDYRTALELYSRALELDPDNSSAVTGKAGALIRLNNLDEGLEILRAALERFPDDPSVLYLLGFALRRKGDDLAAADVYERFLQIVPDAEEAPRIRQWIEEVRGGAAMSSDERLYNAALTQFQEGNLDQALVQVEEALLVNEAHAQANVLLGRILLRKGDYIRAVAALKKAAESKPDDPEIYYYLGQAYEKRGLNEEAREAYEKCLEVSPSGPRAERIREWLEHAMQSGETALGLRCEYCLRTFPAEELFDYQGKKACRECLSHLGVDADSLAAPALEDEAEELPEVEWETFEAEEEQPRRSVFKMVLVFAFILLLLAGGALGGLWWMLRNGMISKSYMEETGVYGLLRRYDLEAPLAAVGIDISKPQSETSSVQTGATDVVKEKGIRSIEFLSDPPGSVGLLESLSYAPRIKVKGKGKVAFSMLRGPVGAKIDSSSGRLAWDPFADPAVKEVPFVASFAIKAASGKIEQVQKFKVKVGLRVRRKFVFKASVPAGAEVSGTAAGDFNRDGKEDLVICWRRFDAGEVEVYYRNTPVSFSGPKMLDVDGGIAPAAGDFDGDGDQDIAVLAPAGHEVMLFLQNEKRSLGKGTELPVGEFPVSLGVSRDGRVLYVLCTDEDGVLYSREASGKVVKEAVPYPVSVFSRLAVMETVYIYNLPGVGMARRWEKGWKKVALGAPLPMKCMVSEGALAVSAGFLVEDGADGGVVVSETVPGVVASVPVSEADTGVKMLFAETDGVLTAWVVRGDKRVRAASFEVAATVVGSHGTGASERTFILADGTIMGVSW